MAIPCGGIGDRDGWRLLKDHGLNVTTNGKYRAILADWMQLSGSHEEWQLSTTTGWHFGAYIMPDGSIIGDSENRSCLPEKVPLLMAIRLRVRRRAGATAWRGWLVAIRP